jgi:hypothetical protein
MRVGEPVTRGARRRANTGEPSVVAVGVRANETCERVRVGGREKYVGCGRVRRVNGI